MCLGVIEWERGDGISCSIELHGGWDEEGRKENRERGEERGKGRIVDGEKGRERREERKGKGRKESRRKTL